jgi:hypothetical protein
MSRDVSSLREELERIKKTLSFSSESRGSAAGLTTFEIDAPILSPIRLDEELQRLGISKLNIEHIDLDNKKLTLAVILRDSQSSESNSEALSVEENESPTVRKFLKRLSSVAN